MKKLVVTIAVTLVLSSLALAGYELYLARFDPDASLLAVRKAKEDWRWGTLIHRRSEIEGLEYELNPGFEGGYKGIKIRINADGLRGDDVAPEKGPDVLRIAVLGDSTTFGFGVAGQHVYTQKLEDRLNVADTGWEYEVLNFGVSGYSTIDEALVLREKAIHYDPDLIVVAYNLNDPDVERRQPLHRFFGETAWWQNTHTWRKYDHRRYAHALKYFDNDPFRYGHEPGRRNWQSVVDGFAQIAATAREHGIPVLLVIFPVGIAPADPRDYRYRDLHLQVGTEGRKHGFVVLDLTKTFAALQARGVEYLLPDMHPNVQGHAAAARALTERILGRHEELLGRPKRPSREQ